MRSSPVIRPLVRADEPFLWRALWLAVHVAPGAPAPDPAVVRRPELARYVAGWMRRPGDAGVLAEIDGAPVGAAWLRLWADAERGGDRGYGFVDADTPELSMAVVPERRGAGVGTALLAALLAQAQPAHRAVSLSVSASNPARRLYARMGFEAVRRDAESLVMRRALT